MMSVFRPGHEASEELHLRFDIPISDLIKKADPAKQTHLPNVAKILKEP